MGDPSSIRLRHHNTVVVEANDLLTQSASTRDKRGGDWQLSSTRCVTLKSYLHRLEEFDPVLK